MVERLDFWLAIFTLGALAYYELRLGRVLGPIARSIVGAAGWAADQGREAVAEHQRRKLRPRPTRDARGRFDGSMPATVPERNTVPAESSAVERGVSPGNDVPSGTINAAEVALIAYMLGQGKAPGVVAKSLPGYSARKYQSYAAKVNQVQADLAKLAPEETAQTA